MGSADFAMMNFDLTRTVYPRPSMHAAKARSQALRACLGPAPGAPRSAAGVRARRRRRSGGCSVPGTNGDRPDGCAQCGYTGGALERAWAFCPGCARIGGRLGSTPLSAFTQL